MDNIVKTTIMMDYYGQFLSKKQYEIMDLYYNNNYSLSEIAEHFNISRQGVYDIIKRCKDTLDKFEEKLGLVEKSFIIKNNLLYAVNCLEEIDTSNLQENDKTKISQALDIINKLLKEDH